MNHFDKWNNEFLIFNKRARTAVLSIVFIGVLLLIASELYYTIYHPLLHTEIQLTEKDKEDIRELKKIKSTKELYKKNYKKFEKKIPSKFNPNNYTKKDWKALGFSEKQSASIMNFQKSGFVFKQKSDVLKLFVVDSSYYFKIKDSIDLPEVYRSLKTKKYRKFKSLEKEEVLEVALNSATKVELKSIPGIGDFYSDRILKFRNALGGFSSKSQLKEVYGLTDSLYNHISNHITVDTTKLKKYNLNQINKEILAKHPYINYKLANSIVAYRKTHGDYQSVEDLKKLISLSKKDFLKIRPYLDVK